MDESIEVDTYERYGWECPKCGCYNEIDQEPSVGEIVDCDECDCNRIVSRVNGL